MRWRGRYLWFALCGLLGILLLQGANCGFLEIAGLKKLKKEKAEPKQELQRGKNAVEEGHLFREGRARLDGPLTSRRAVELTLEHSLDLAVQSLEWQSRAENAAGVKMRVLPDLQATWDQERRNNHAASTSASLETQVLGDSWSYSASRLSQKWELKSSWSLIDFGLAVLQARQEADRARIQRERWLRARQNLAFDATKAFWRARVAEEAVHAARTLYEAARRRQEAVERQLREKITERAGLDAKRRMLLLQMRLQGLEREQNAARAELAGLIGLPPGAAIEFADEAAADLSEPVLDLAACEDEALLRRPELYEKDLEASISTSEVRSSLISMLPSPSGILRLNREDSRFLYYDTWNTAGIHAAWDLLSLPEKLQSRKVALKNREVAHQRRLQMAVGILIQLRIAAIDYQEAWAQYSLADQFARVQEEYLASTRKHLGAGLTEAGEVLEVEAEALFAKIKARTAYADLIVAGARMRTSLGREPLVEAPLPCLGDGSVGPEMAEEAERAEPVLVENLPEPAPVTIPTVPTAAIPAALAASASVSDLPVPELSESEFDEAPFSGMPVPEEIESAIPVAPIAPAVREKPFAAPPAAPAAEAPATETPADDPWAFTPELPPAIGDSPAPVAEKAEESGSAPIARAPLWSWP